MRVLLVPNPANPRSVEATGQLCARLAASGYQPVLALDDADACGVGGFGVSRAEIGEPGLALALGGDGTILKAVHLLGLSEVPVLGINLGRLGFLSGADGEALDVVVEAALAGEAAIEHRQTLEASMTVGGRTGGEYRALNEVFVGRAPGARVVELEVSVNRTRVGGYLCDGVVVATPTGSTAYALSVGGPPMSPDVRAMIIVPVAPHTLNARPIVTGPGDLIRISCPNPSRADACVAVDGDHVPCRASLDSVEIRVGDHDVRLMRFDGRDFYEVLSQTFLGG